MARTYSTSDLALNDPTDADWALAYVRFALRDKPNDANAFPSDSLEDEEINAALTGNRPSRTVSQRTCWRETLGGWLASMLLGTARSCGT